MLFSLLFVFSLENEANKEYEDGNFARAIKIYNRILHTADSSEKILNALKGLGNCYYELGMFERASFYFERFIERESEDIVYIKLSEILYQTGRLSRASNVAEKIEDDFRRYDKLAQIKKSQKELKKSAKYNMKLYEISSDLDYVEKALNLNINIYEDYKEIPQVRLVYFMIKGEKEKARQVIYEDIFDGDDKLNNVYGYLSSKKSPFLISVAEHMYEHNKSSMNFKRLIRAYYMSGNLKKADETIEDRRKQISDKAFINNNFHLFTELSMYDRAINIIREIPGYIDEQSLYSKLLDLYRISMSYNQYYNELIKLFKEKIINQGYIQSRVIRNFRNRREWAESFLNHKIFKTVDNYTSANAFHYAAKYKKAAELIYKLEENDINRFLSSTNSLFIYADKLEFDKIPVSIALKLLPHISEENLYDYINNENEEIFYETLFLLTSRGALGYDELIKEIEKKVNINEIIENVEKKIYRIYGSIKNKDYPGVVESDSIYEKFARNYLRLKKYSKEAVRLNININKYDYLLKLTSIIFFHENKFNLLRDVYEKGRINHDILYLCAVIFTEDNPESLIISESKWENLELYKIFKLTSEEDLLMEVKKFYREVVNN
ncbi:MAG: tetratricopeptide repeat protein [Candidatus Muiribacteriota bacterium]